MNKKASGPAIIAVLLMGIMLVSVILYENYKFSEKSSMGEQEKEMFRSYYETALAYNYIENAVSLSAEEALRDGKLFTEGLGCNTILLGNEGSKKEFVVVSRDYENNCLSNFDKKEAYSFFGNEAFYNTFIKYLDDYPSYENFVKVPEDYPVKEFSIKDGKHLVLFKSSSTDITYEGKEFISLAYRKEINSYSPIEYKTLYDRDSSVYSELPESVSVYFDSAEDISECMLKSDFNSCLLSKKIPGTSVSKYDFYPHFSEEYPSDMAVLNFKHKTEEFGFFGSKINFPNFVFIDDGCRTFTLKEGDEKEIFEGHPGMNVLPKYNISLDEVTPYSGEGIFTLKKDGLAVSNSIVLSMVGVSYTKDIEDLNLQLVDIQHNFGPVQKSWAKIKVCYK